MRQVSNLYLYQEKKSNEDGISEDKITLFSLFLIDLTCKFVQNNNNNAFNDCNIYK